MCHFSTWIQTFQGISLHQPGLYTPIDSVSVWDNFPNTRIKPNLSLTGSEFLFKISACCIYATPFFFSGRDQSWENFKLANIFTLSMNAAYNSKSINFTLSSALNLEKQRSQWLRNGCNPHTRRLQVLYRIRSPQSGSSSKKCYTFERVRTSASSTGGVLQKPEATNASCRPRVCPSLPPALIVLLSFIERTQAEQAALSQHGSRFPAARPHSGHKKRESERLAFQAEPSGLERY